MSIRWDCLVYDSLPSTQDVVRTELLSGASEGLVVQAEVQTAGRGRRGNQWVSPVGNLYMSILLKPACAPALAGQMAFVVALAVAEAVHELTGQGDGLALKWPNDILVDGVKCAGILLESDLGPAGTVDALIIGIGININAAPVDRIGLAQLAGHELDVITVRDRVLHHLGRLYARWKTEGFGWVRDAWMARAHGLNTPITARLHGGDVSGIFLGIDDNGALLLQTPDGSVQAIHAGEVYFPNNA